MSIPEEFFSSPPLRRERDDNDDNYQHEQHELQEQQELEQQLQSPTTNTIDITQDRFKNGCRLTLMEALDAVQQQLQRQKSPLPPRFVGVLKERYSDFIVRERAPTPLFLTSMDVPESCKDPLPPQVDEYKLPSEEKMREVLTEVLSVDGGGTNVTSDVDVLIDALKENPQIEQVTLPTPRTDKLTRSKIHQALKLCGFPESGTTRDDRILVFANPPPAAAKGGRRDGGGGGGGGSGKNMRGHYGGRQGGQPQFQQTGSLINRALWPPGRGEHLHFTLYKENLESSAALRQVATKLGIPLRMIQYCGNKDKRAVTTQRVSCRFLSAQSVAKINGMSYGRSSIVRLGDFEYKSDPLQLGRLLGNGFTIVLRRVNDQPQLQQNSSIIEESLRHFEQSIRQNGFVNYFGPQRFGTTGIPSYEVGKALLRCDYAAALLLCFESKAQICPDFVEALKAYRDEKDIAKALKLTPYYCTFERDALVALNASNKPNDVQRAILALPRPLTMLYCHSVQSLVWNTMVADRLRIAPFVLEGDLVLAEGSKLNDGVAADLENEEVEEEVEVLEGPQQQQEQRGQVLQGESPSSPSSSPLPAVRFVTSQDVESNKYKLSDILLPIPGNDPELQYPQNAISAKDAFVRVMHHSLGIGDGLLKANEFTEKRFHIHGAYRHIVVVPKNFTLKLSTYSSNNELLVETDFQKLVAKNNSNNNNSADDSAATVDAAGSSLVNPKKTTDADSGDAVAEQQQSTKKKIAVITTFELPAGAYATSVLREMCDVVSDSRLLYEKQK